MVMQPFGRGLASVDLESHIERNGGMEAGHHGDLPYFQTWVLLEQRDRILHSMIVDELTEVPA